MISALTTTHLPGVDSPTTDGVLGSAHGMGFVRIDGVEGAQVGSNGGYTVVLVGRFPAQGATLGGSPVAVRVKFVAPGGAEYLGYVGPVGALRGPQGWGRDPRPFGAGDAWTTAATRLEVTTPPMPVGAYKIVAEDWPSQTEEVEAPVDLEVVTPTTSSVAASLRGELPPPRAVDFDVGGL